MIFASNKLNEIIGSILFMNFYRYVIVPFFILGMGSFPGFPTYAATK